MTTRGSIPGGGGEKWTLSKGTSKCSWCTPAEKKETTKKRSMRAAHESSTDGDAGGPRWGPPGSYAGARPRLAFGHPVQCYQPEEDRWTGVPIPPPI